MDTHSAMYGNHCLHHFALLADDEGVRQALREGADINALDKKGRTAIMCAVAGENWQVISDDASFMSNKRIKVLKIILSYPSINLLTLNAMHPSMSGVTPLGMASWLNQPQAVRTLLETSNGRISVDGMDSHGATALMYAARDGNLEVTQILLSYGARPDFRDHNHRSPIQFAQRHPQILRLCELILKYSRWRNSRSPEKFRLSVNSKYLVKLMQSSLPTSNYLDPPLSSIFTPEATLKFTEALVSAIRSSNLSFINAMLFSPALHPLSPPALYPISVPSLVNLPDANGWSLIHHCVATTRPSIDILDALYCAGADVALFTVSEEQTPLHILARFAGSAPSDHDVTPSLHNFCLHLIRDLLAPLSARDKNEETCLHIAAEYGHSADLLMTLLNCDTAGDVCKMKNSRGLTPLEVAKEEFAFVFSNNKDETRCESALSNYTVRPSNSFASPKPISASVLPAFVPNAENAPGNTGCTASTYPGTDREVRAAIRQLLSDLQATSVSLNHPIQMFHVRSLRLHVQDITQQSNSILYYLRGCIENVSRVVHDLQETSSEIDLMRYNVATAASELSVLSGISQLESTKHEHEDQELEVGIFEGYVSTQSLPSDLYASLSVAMSQDTLEGPKDQDLRTLSKKRSFTVASIKTWLKRAVVPKVVTSNQFVEAKPILDLDSENNSNMGLKVERQRLDSADPNHINHCIYNALRTSGVVLKAAHRDLLTINQCLETAQRFINLANDSVSRVQRVVECAVDKRDAIIGDLLSGVVLELEASDVKQAISPCIVQCDNTISQRPSLASVYTAYTDSSVAVTPTIAGNRDEDIRTIRRLLLRKIEAQISGAWAEVDTAAPWLDIVNEAVRGIKRRSHM